MTFQHKKLRLLFSVSISRLRHAMLTWYSNVKKICEILSDESGGIHPNDPIHCALNWLLKSETQKWFYSLSISGCVILKTQGFFKNIIHLLGLFHFLVKSLMETHGIQGTGYIVSSLGYTVHGFKNTGYMVSEVLGVRVHSFSLPELELRWMTHAKSSFSWLIRKTNQLH